VASRRIGRAGEVVRSPELLRSAVRTADCAEAPKIWKVWRVGGFGVSLPAVHPRSADRLGSVAASVIRVRRRIAREVEGLAKDLSSGSARDLDSAAGVPRRSCARNHSIRGRPRTEAREHKGD
jgi:hypothetical protein